MNNIRRKYLRNARKKLNECKQNMEEIKNLAEIALEEEIESYENIPERFSDSAQTIRIEEVVDLLENLVSEIYEIEESMDNLEVVINEILSGK